MVLQRLQSLYLLIAAIFLGIFTFTTSTTITNGENEFLIGALATGAAGKTAPNFVLCVLNALTAILALITIFKFKNLKLQLKLCSICILLTIVIAISIAILTYQALKGGELHDAQQRSAWIGCSVFLLGTQRRSKRQKNNSKQREFQIINYFFTSHTLTFYKI